MLLQGCQSTKKIEYVVPDIDFPVFPLADSITNNNDGTCTVNDEWIVQLRMFQIDYERCEKDYRQIKEVWNEESADLSNKTE